MQGKLKNSLLSGQHGAWLKTRVLLLNEKRKNKLEGTVDSMWHNKHSKRPSAERALSKGMGVFASILSVRIVCSYRHQPSWVPEAQWLHCLGATCSQETVLLFPYVDLSVLIKRRRGNP